MERRGQLCKWPQISISAVSFRRGRRRSQLCKWPCAWICPTFHLIQLAGEWPQAEPIMQMNSTYCPLFKVSWLQFSWRGWSLLCKWSELVTLIFKFTRLRWSKEAEPIMQISVDHPSTNWHQIQLGIRLPVAMVTGSRRSGDVTRSGSNQLIDDCAPCRPRNVVTWLIDQSHGLG